MTRAPADPAPESFDSFVEEPTPVRDVRERRFGRYVLEYELASGGMATVYAARARGAAGFEKLVAIKRIHPHLARRRSFVEMFLDEARIASRIDHPNVCSVFDFGDVDGSYYLAMEYLVGEPLARMARAVAREPERLESDAWRALAARIVADAAEGLHAAHELADDAGRPLGVVHRDVSPHNIMITYEGAVKVVDFGIAVAADRLHHTATGVIKGKYAYMAPEQLRGDVDRRTDIWALGVCLWELLTGQRLFRRKTERETLLAVEREEIPAPSTVRPGVSETLDAVVMRALRRDPNERLPTARQMAKELEAYVREAGQPVGLGELSEWMDRLLVTERERKLEVVETALEGDTEPEVGPPVSGAIAAPGTEVSGAKPSRGRRLRRRLALGLGALAVVGAALGLGMALGRSGSAPGASQGQAGAASEAGGAAASASPTETASATGSGIGTDAATGPAPAPETETETATETETTTETETETATETETETARAKAAQRARRRAEAARRRAERRVKGKGTVNVTAVGGWAEIYENGRYHGRTPLQLRLSAGRHVLELRPFGDGSPRRVPVVVSAGETERVRVPVSRD